MTKEDEVILKILAHLGEDEIMGFVERQYNHIKKMDATPREIEKDHGLTSMDIRISLREANEYLERCISRSENSLGIYGYTTRYRWVDFIKQALKHQTPPVSFEEIIKELTHDQATNK